MRRREVIIGVGAALAGARHIARAQGTARPLLGFLHSDPAAANAVNDAAFLEGMQGLGYRDGRNFDLAARYGDNDYAHLGVLAKELVALNPALILAAEPPSVLAAKQATASIPIVGALLAYPVEQGLVASYARPGGNLTGILVIVQGVWSKWVEIALELAPQATTIGLLVNPTNVPNTISQKDVENAAKAAKLQLVVAEARAKDEIEPAVAKLKAAEVQVAMGGADALLVSERDDLCRLLNAARIPTIFGNREFVDAGGLMSYSVNNAANYRRAAYYVDRILKGAKPADLPIEFPAKLELIVNLKTAKTIRLSVPQSLLVQADQVIE